MTHAWAVQKKADDDDASGIRQAVRRALGFCLNGATDECAALLPSLTRYGTERVAGEAGCAGTDSSEDSGRNFQVDRQQTCEFAPASLARMARVSVTHHDEHSA